MRDRIVVCCENRRKSGPYTEALLLMGVDVENILLLTPEETPENVVNLGAGAAGVVLCGGPDLDPQRYGEQPRTDANLSVLPALDLMDWNLLQGAAEGRTPVWPIAGACRPSTSSRAEPSGRICLHNSRLFSNTSRTHPPVAGPPHSGRVPSTVLRPDPGRRSHSGQQPAPPGGSAIGQAD